MNRATLLAVFLTLASLPASAQSLFEQGAITALQNNSMSGARIPSLPTGMADPNSMTGVTSGLSLDSIKAMVEKQGYAKITDLMPSPSTGVLQATAVNAAGIPTNLQIDPANGNILSALAAH
jgi:hypothetical protein